MADNVVSVNECGWCGRGSLADKSMQSDGEASRQEDWGGMSAVGPMLARAVVQAEAEKQEALLRHSVGEIVEVMLGGGRGPVAAERHSRASLPASRSQLR